MIIHGKTVILVITETKTDSTFSLHEFVIQGYSKPYWFDRNRNGGGVFIYVREDIKNRELKFHNTSEDIESIFIEINLIKLSGFFGAAITHLASLINIYLTILEKARQILKTLWKLYACWWFQRWRFWAMPITVPLWIQCQEHCRGKHLF